MNRRQFLRFAGVPVAAAVAAPELLKTIILPPRGGWPDLSRYFASNTAWYLDTSKNDFDTTKMVYVYRERRGIRLEHLEGFKADLEQYWRDAYDGKLVDQFGQPIPGFAESWRNLYGSEGA